MKIFTLFILSLISLFLSLNFEKILLLQGISFKPVIILIYFVTLYWNPLYGLFAGFFIGFIYEVYLPVLVGTFPLIFISVSLLLKIAENKIFKFRYNSLMLLFFTVLIVSLIQVIVEANLPGSIFYVFITQLIPIAILNSVVGFVILYFIKRYSHNN